MAEINNILGMRFGRLVVREIAGRCRRKVTWKCLCDCGETTIVVGYRLRAGQTKSCGCLMRDMMADKQRTHGMHGTPEYRAYTSAKDRCTNTKLRNYYRYGGRGIEFRFRSFEEFFATLGHRPSPKHSLDRINNDGHYEPSNVKWSEEKDQSRNRSMSVYVTISGTTLNRKDWADQIGISDVALKYRISRGWCDDCLVQPGNRKGCSHIK